MPKPVGALDAEQIVRLSFFDYPFVLRAVEILSENYGLSYFFLSLVVTKIVRA